MTKATGVGRGGSRPGAGRPQGVKNRFSQAALAEREVLLSKRDSEREHGLAAALDTLRRSFAEALDHQNLRFSQLNETLGLVLRKLTQLERRGEPPVVAGRRWSEPPARPKAPAQSRAQAAETVFRKSPPNSPTPVGNSPTQSPKSPTQSPKSPTQSPKSPTPPHRDRRATLADIWPKG